ncbi:MAG: pilus assembly protein [Rhizobiaceae bacterium]
MLFHDFVRDRGGNYAIAVVVGLVPLMGSVALAVDYAELNRERQAMLSALDAAGIATARHIVSGATDEAVIAYAKDFFEANLGPVDPADTNLSVVLPNNEAGGGTLKLSATLNYTPYFFPAFQEMMNRQAQASIDSSAATEIRLKNTLEVALVLDNSGSMNYTGSGSGEKRIDLLKTAAKQLVDTLANQAALIKQVEKPVQFGLVPFAASVNVGSANSGAAWMDSWGVSPVHHENFDWTKIAEAERSTEKVGDVWYKRGTGWGDGNGKALSRFTLFEDIKEVVSKEWVPDQENGEEHCIDWDDGDCENYDVGYYEVTYDSFTSWQGCVEARPYPYNVNDEPATAVSNGVAAGNPETLFVPMFAPDEPGDRWETEEDAYPDYYDASNNWWNDGTESSSGRTRLINMAKYLEPLPIDASTGYGTGPNYSCTTNAITPLVDVTTETGINTIKTAIDAMQPNGGTNVPEGLAWGWRVVSGGAPFTEGRPDSEKGNDKIVIVLTDGKNTYYTPGSLGFNDTAGAKSIYSSYGYLKPGYGANGYGRLFHGTSSAVGKSDYSNSNYTRALNEQMASVCGNAKMAGMTIMTVSLDLSSYGDSEAIAALKSCASDSRFRKEASGQPAKLYWNATGGSLSDTFKEIADELSNLRIVS